MLQLKQVKTKPTGNLTAGNDLVVFFLYVSCIGNTSPLIDSASVTVTLLLSLALFRAMCFEFFAAIVTFSVGIYFNGINIDN